MDVHEGLSALELLVLRAIPRARNIEDLAKLTKVPPATLGRTLAKLQIEGYIGGSGGLTEKGKDATGV
ncbi:MAG: MarR family transcriptional regulator [Thaumarchaeota archaeon]|nr:MarR family transcriptional regulator [Nitrososphaerota archaeon]